MAISPPIIRPIKKRSFHNWPPDKGWHCVTPRKNGPSKPAIPAIFPSTMYDSAADSPIIIPPIADSTGVNMMLLVVSLVSSTRLSFWKFWATGSQSSNIFCTSIKTGINMLFYFQSHNRSLWFSFQDSNEWQTKSEVPMMRFCQLFRWDLPSRPSPLKQNMRFPF